ncbi:type II toxin-antitoxin system ParD family antitoxin [Methylobacterium sp. J-048]|uniref:type II toxin-antitoxin system ParD family antitoxin n=1 Tax=Methylobacterium sp. J-048 TaxID=2836635 RepID=UPI001FB9EEA8|nr:type II toxin-antitoxin system ParD family antitoxin [Methylobacterium sp. J-048]MCJ2060610.1 type II toxin-antitoxin system ParD family antitoxin [Methylobacterium sp. J-048]
MTSLCMAKAPTSLNVSLTPELAAFIAVRVASGRYLSASEVVRAGLRLLERDEAGWASLANGIPRPQAQVTHGSREHGG